MAELPPWLNVNPQSYLSAAEAGGQAGQRSADMAMQQQQFAQQQALKQQELMQAQKQFQDEQRYKQQQANIANEYNRMQLQQRAEEQSAANAQAAAKFDFEKQQGMASEAVKQKEYELNINKLGLDTKFNYDKLNADVSQHAATTNLQQKKDLESNIRSQISQLEKRFETMSSIASKAKNEESRIRAEEEASRAKRAADAAQLRLNAVESSPTMGQQPQTAASAFGSFQGEASQPATAASSVAQSPSSPSDQGGDQSQGPITYTSPQGGRWTVTPATSGKKSFQKTSGNLAGLYKGLSADESYSPQQRAMFEKMSKDFASDSGVSAPSYPAPPTLPDPPSIDEDQKKKLEPPSIDEDQKKKLEPTPKDKGGSVFDDFGKGFKYQTEQTYTPSPKEDRQMGMGDVQVKEFKRQAQPEIILEKPTDVMQSPEHKSLTTKYNKLAQDKFRDPQFNQAFDRALVKVLDLREGVETESGFSGKYTFDSMMKHVSPQKRMKFYKEVLKQYDKSVSEETSES
jgi:hypothetical protein